MTTRIFAYVVDSDEPFAVSHQETLEVFTDADVVTGAPLSVLDEGVEVSATTLSVDFVGDCVEATSDGVGNVTVAVDCGGGGGTGGPYVDWAAGDGAGGITTSSSSLVDMPQMSVTVPATAGDKLALVLTATFGATSGSGFVAVTFSVGGTDLGWQQLESIDTNSHAVTTSFPHLVDGGEVSGGNVTVKARWRQGGSITVEAFNESAGQHRVPVLTVTNNH